MGRHRHTALFNKIRFPFVYKVHLKLIDLTKVMYTLSTIIQQME